MIFLKTAVMILINFQNLMETVSILDKWYPRVNKCTLWTQMQPIKTGFTDQRDFIFVW
jgi:hypothetical protein